MKPRRLIASLMVDWSQRWKNVRGDYMKNVQPKRKRASLLTIKSKPGLVRTQPGTPHKLILGNRNERRTCTLSWCSQAKQQHVCDTCQDTSNLDRLNFCYKRKDHRGVMAIHDCFKLYHEAKNLNYEDPAL